MSAVERIAARAVARATARLAAALGPGAAITSRGVEVERPDAAVRRWPAGAIR